MIIGQGVQFGGGVRVISELPAGIITTGLVMNLATAPSSGTTWTDTSGNGYNGTITGSSYSYTSTPANGIVVTGSESGTYISTGYNISSSTFTISMAATMNPVSYWSTWWGNESYTAQYGYLAYQSGSSNITMGGPSGPYAYSAFSNYTSLAIWDFVFSGTSVILYKNGVSYTSGTITVPSTFATDGLYFGSRHANGGGATNTDNCAGTYYSMRVYNIALNSTQIAQNYAALKGTYGLS